MSQEMIDSLEKQVCSLYAEKDHLVSRFGTADAEEIADMVTSLEQQLQDFYSRFGGIDGDSDNATMLLLGQIKQLSSNLDDQYSRKSVQFTFENGQPVLRAEWTEENNQGDAR